MTALFYTSGTAISARMAGGTADIAVFNAIGTAVNEWIENYIGAPVGPSGTAARTYDGDGSSVLWIRQGVNAIATLEVADQTGGTFSTVTGAVIRPHDHDRPSGWPGFKVILPYTATPYTTFTCGYDTVRVTPTGNFGWAAIPPELSQVAVRMGTRLFQSRKSGEGMAVGETDTGTLIFRDLTLDDRATLDRYRQVISPAHVG